MDSKNSRKNASSYAPHIDAADHLQHQQPGELLRQIQPALTGTMPQAADPQQPLGADPLGQPPPGGQRKDLGQIGDGDQRHIRAVGEVQFLQHERRKIRAGHLDGRLHDHQEDQQLATAATLPDDAASAATGSAASCSGIGVGSLCRMSIHTEPRRQSPATANSAANVS